MISASESSSPPRYFSISSSSTPLISSIIASRMKPASVSLLRLLASVLGLIASIPFTRLFHFIAGPINIFLAPAQLGVLNVAATCAGAGSASSSSHSS